MLWSSKRSYNHLISTTTKLKAEILNHSGTVTPTVQKKAERTGGREVSSFFRVVPPNLLFAAIKRQDHSTRVFPKRVVWAFFKSWNKSRALKGGTVNWAIAVSYFFFHSRVWTTILNLVLQIPTAITYPYLEWSGLDVSTSSFQRSE